MDDEDSTEVGGGELKYSEHGSVISRGGIAKRGNDREDGKIGTELLSFGCQIMYYFVFLPSRLGAKARMKRIGQVSRGDCGFSEALSDGRHGLVGRGIIEMNEIGVEVI